MMDIIVHRYAVCFYTGRPTTILTWEGVPYRDAQGRVWGGVGPGDKIRAHWPDGRVSEETVCEFEHIDAPGPAVLSLV